MMEHTCRKLAPWVAVVLFASLAPRTSAQEELNYGPRPYRYEGVKARPVSGFDIELLSALINYRDEAERPGDRFRIRFFLPRPEDVHIVVRELDYRQYYWLDKVRPKTPWKAGFNNEFEWPTHDVVRPLGIRRSELGVIVRLGQENPSAVEKVAPVVFYESQLPPRVSSYVFHFKLREDAKMKAGIYRQGKGDPVLSLDLGRQRGGRPFAVRWDVSSPPVEGAYKLVLSGYLLSNTDPVSQVVEFHHRSLIE